MTGVPWIDLKPNTKNAWLTEGLEIGFDNFLPIGSKETKTQKELEVKAIFKNYGRGVATCRDEWDYDFDKTRLSQKMAMFIIDYNAEVARWKQRPDKTVSVDSFVNPDSQRFKWSEGLKSYLQRGRQADFDKDTVSPSMYRPFCKQWLYFDSQFVERVYQMPNILPPVAGRKENHVINITAPGCAKSFHSIVTDCVPDLHLTGDSQCFPLYTYALDGKLRRDNVTDWALAQFQAKYGPDVTKRDIFHYVYGLLHSAEYRETYKENLKRELPRIPLVGGEGVPLAPNNGGTGSEGLGVGTGSTEGAGQAEGAASSAPTDTSLTPPLLGAGGTSPFRAFVQAGSALAALHLGYETAAEYPLTQSVNKDVPWSWRVTKMRLNKDKTAVQVNDALTLGGIPPEAFDYKLGNRSALEWVIDQYQVSTDTRSGIVTDPNRADDPEYIVRLVRRVVTVSVETAKVVTGLPPLTPLP